MKSRLLSFLALLLVALPVGPASAADLRNVLTDCVLTSWNNKEGLPPGTVWALAQDRDGYLWVGNDAGLFRFDGARFVAWNALSSAGLPEQPVRALVLAHDESLWPDSADQPASATSSTITWRYGEKEGLSPGAVTTLIEDANRSMWAGNARGLYQFVNGRWEKRPLVEGATLAVASAHVDARGALFIGTSAGLFVREAGASAFVLVDRTTDLVRAIAEDTAGVMWLTDPVTGFRSSRSGRAGVVSTERGRGMRLLYDRRGNMWIATGGQGLWRMRPAPDGGPPTFERATSLTGLLGDGVYSLLEDRDGNVWAGTTEGLNRLTPRKISQIVDLGIVRGVEKTPDANVWVGTVDGLVEFGNAGTRLREWRPDDARVTALSVDDRGTLWVATTRSLVRVVDGRATALPVADRELLKEVESIAPDGQGGLWLYNTARGLLRWDGTHAKSVTMPFDPHATRVTAMYSDRTGRLWLGLSTGQVAVAPRDGAFQVFGPSDGLDGGVYDSFHEDDGGVVWLGGSSGISRYWSGQFVTLRSRDGLPANGVVAVISDAGDSLWFGSNAGIVHIDKNEFGKATADRTYSRISPRPLGWHCRRPGRSREQPARRSRRDGRLWFVRRAASRS
jgi:ligand-binding sensor domain-containing protein